MKEPKGTVTVAFASSDDHHSAVITDVAVDDLGRHSRLMTELHLTLCREHGSGEGLPFLSHRGNQLTMCYPKGGTREDKLTMLRQVFGRYGLAVSHSEMTAAH